MLWAFVGPSSWPSSEEARRRLGDSARADLSVSLENTVNLFLWMVAIIVPPANGSILPCGLTMPQIYGRLGHTKEKYFIINKLYRYIHVIYTVCPPKILSLLPHEHMCYPDLFCPCLVNGSPQESRYMSATLADTATSVCVSKGARDSKVPRPRHPRTI